ncbi:MAG: DUF1109 family protein [Acidobacteriaceae bacterium]|nr:DUF1109 family protein [Acidobacteriaceae bacterium]
MNRLQALITMSLAPVRPLPSDRKLAWSLVVLFTAFTLITAIPVGYNGFHVLNAQQKFAYYALMLVCAACLSITIVQEMIPGSKHRISPRWTIVAAIFSLALLVSVLFHNFDLHAFVPLGIPCLRLGCLCALVSGALSWFALRRGFFASPLTASATVGSFAGLAGVAVLALHCPIQNSAHIIVWHLSVIVLGAIVGAVAGAL